MGEPKTMSRSGELWMQLHERALERFIAGEDDREAFISNLIKLGFGRETIQNEIAAAEDAIAEAEAAYEAGAEYFDRYIAGDQS